MADCNKISLQIVNKWDKELPFESTSLIFENTKEIRYRSGKILWLGSDLQNQISSRCIHGSP